VPILSLLKLNKAGAGRQQQRIASVPIITLINNSRFGWVPLKLRNQRFVTEHVSYRPMARVKTYSRYSGDNGKDFSSRKHINRQPPAPLGFRFLDPCLKFSQIVKMAPQILILCLQLVPVGFSTSTTTQQHDRKTCENVKPNHHVPPISREPQKERSVDIPPALNSETKSPESQDRRLSGDPNMKNNSIINFVKTAHQLATKIVKNYSSKFSKHTFTQPQLVTLNLLRLKLRLTYRDFTALLRPP